MSYLLQGLQNIQMHLNNSKSCAGQLDMVHFDKIYEMVTKASRRENKKDEKKKLRKNQREANEDVL